MKKILYTKFQNMDELLAQMAKDKELSRAITRNNLYKFWVKAAGEKFAQNSKPYSMIKGSIMVVACKSPIVAQELMLRKTQILEKLKPLCIELDKKANDKIAGFKDVHEGIITTKKSKIPVYVIPTNEEIMIIRDTYKIAMKK